MLYRLKNLLVDDFLVVSIFTKRRNTDGKYDSFINQNMASGNFGMNAYMCIFNEGEKTTVNLRKFSENVFQTMNKYASNKENNSHYVEYRGDISTNVPVNEQKSVEHYIINESVVKILKGYYAKEIDEGYFQLDIDLIHAFLKERKLR